MNNKPLITRNILSTHSEGEAKLNTRTASRLNFLISCLFWAQYKLNYLPYFKVTSLLFAKHVQLNQWTLNMNVPPICSRMCPLFSSLALGPKIVLYFKHKRKIFFISIKTSLSL